MRYKIQGTARDENGAIIASALISVYLAGTNTPASIYTSATSALVVNSVTADSSGNYSFYYEEGNYYGVQTRKIVVSKAGYTSQTYDYHGPSDFVIGAFDDVNIGNALTTIGSDVATLFLRSGTWVLGDNITIPANVTLEVAPGAVINITDTHVLTINGPFVSWLCKCFDDDNATYDGVVFGANSVRESYPEWWGVDGTADDVEINAAILALTTGVVRVSSKTYNIAATIYGKDNVTLCGDGISSVLKAIADFGNQDIITAIDNTGFHVLNLSINGNKANNSTGTTGSHGIQFTYVKKGSIKGCFIESMKGDGIYLGNNNGTPKTSGCDDVIVSGNYIDYPTRNGISLISGERVTITKNIIKNVETVVGIDVEPNSDLPIKNILISKNIIYNAHNGGIGVNLSHVSTASNAKNISVCNNIIDTTTFSNAIATTKAWNVSIKGNQIFNATNDGIYTDSDSYDITVEGNSVDTASKYGIEVRSDRTTVSKNMIRGCIDTALYIVSTVGTIATDNDILSDATVAVNLTGVGLADFIFTGNKITSSGINSNFGLGVTYGTNSIVANNIISGFKYGIYKGNNAADSVIIGPNVLYGNTTNYLDSSQTCVGTITLSPVGVSLLYAKDAAVTATLPDGIVPGTIKIIKMNNASHAPTASTVSVTHHETSDPLLGNFAQTTDAWVLLWNGLKWVTLSNIGVTF